MVVVRTVVTSLPKTAASEKTYRIDPGPAAPSAPVEPPTKPAVVLGTSVLHVNLAQLLADLDAESRRLIGPSAPPPG